MKVEVEVNFPEVETVKKLYGIEPSGRVQKFFTNTCYRYMDKYVPMDFGDLRSNVDVGPDYIQYNSPYASYQYYGIRGDGTHKVQNYTTPGTGPYWDQQMMSAEYNSVLDETQRYANFGIGGLL